MNLEELAQSGREGGPLTLLPQPRFLCASARRTQACLSASHCHTVLAAAPGGRVSPGHKCPLWMGSTGEDSASRGKTTPRIHNSDLTLELLPSGQCWHPGILEPREWLALFQGPRVPGVPSSQKKTDIFGRLESPGEGSLQSS